MLADQCGLAFGQRGGRHRRGQTWSTRQQRAVRDMQTGVAEHLTGMVDHAVVGAVRDRCAAGRVDGEQLVGFASTDGLVLVGRYALAIRVMAASSWANSRGSSDRSVAVRSSRPSNSTVPVEASRPIPARTTLRRSRRRTASGSGNASVGTPISAIRNPTSPLPVTTTPAPGQGP